jgi:hypothetical protein
MSTALLDEPQLVETKVVLEILECDWSQFQRRHGRVPMLGDAKSPWEYPGWLMYYRMLLESRQPIGHRWDYWCRTMFAGEILNEPIPRIDFDAGCVGERSAGYKEIDKWMDLAERHSRRSALQDILDFLLWGFGLTTEMPDLTAVAAEAFYRGINLYPLLEKPYDYLGEWIAMHKGNWNPYAFFPTPHSVVECVTQMNFVGVPEEVSRSQSVCDPALGSARMLLHASNHSLCLYGCDIDPTMVKISKINGALYVPWLVRPFPQHFFTSKIPALGVEVRDSIRIGL